MIKITYGEDLATFITSLNAGASIDSDLLNVLVNTAKAIIEDERPWMVLRKTDTSKVVTTANTWQTAIDLSTITNFSKFYGELPIRLFDGTDRIEYFRQVPWDRRLEYKNVSNTFVYDENSKTGYINGTVAFNATIWINYITSTNDIDRENTSTVIWSEFPSRFIPLLGFYAVGIHMGAVDYDTVTAHQAPNQMAIMQTLKNSMETWDNDRQASAIESNDPSDLYNYPRSGAINRNQE